MRYAIKSAAGRREYLEILQRTEAGYHVRIVRCCEGYDDVTESFLETHLFEMCLQTGYIREESPDTPSQPVDQPTGVYSVA